MLHVSQSGSPDYALDEKELTGLLRELTKDDWLKMLEIPKDRIPHAVVLRGTRNLKTRYAAMRERFSRVRDIGSPNGLLEDVFIGMLGDTWLPLLLLWAPYWEPGDKLEGVVIFCRFHLGGSGGLVSDESVI